jgi:hypothetical protein
LNSAWTSPQTHSTQSLPSVESSTVTNGWHCFLRLNFHSIHSLLSAVTHSFLRISLKHKSSWTPPRDLWPKNSRWFALIAFTFPFRQGSCCPWFEREPFSM